MATTFEHVQNENSLGRLPRRVLRSIWRGLIRLGERHPAYRRIRALQKMNDAELAKLGLRREDIATHVLRRYGVM